MKHILCVLGIHKMRTMDWRGICREHVCIRCGLTTPGIKWPDPPAMPPEKKAKIDSKFVGSITEEEVYCGEFCIKFRVEPYGEKFKAFFLGKAINNKFFIGNTQDEALEKASAALRIDVRFITKENHE